LNTTRFKRHLTEARRLNSGGASRANQARIDQSPGSGGACRRPDAGGAPGLSCASALDDQGNIHYYYEVEPLGVYLAELVTGSNIRLYYTSGDDVVKAG